jgi:hypothetical protein
MFPGDMPAGRKEEGSNHPRDVTVGKIIKAGRLKYETN